MRPCDLVKGRCRGPPERKMTPSRILVCAGARRSGESNVLAARALGPCPRSKVTDWPSCRSSKRIWLQAELWKKYSLPSEARMKPKPLSLTSRLIVPFSAAICSVLV